MDAKKDKDWKSMINMLTWDTPWCENLNLPKTTEDTVDKTQPHDDDDDDVISIRSVHVAISLIRLWPIAPPRAVQ